MKKAATGNFTRSEIVTMLRALALVLALVACKNAHERAYLPPSGAVKVDVAGGGETQGEFGPPNPRRAPSMRPGTSTLLQAGVTSRVVGRPGRGELARGDPNGP